MELFECEKCNTKYFRFKTAPAYWVELKSGKYACKNCKDSINIIHWNFKNKKV